MNSLDQLKDHFLSSVSHEFRSPLSALKGYLELLYKQRQELSARHQDYLMVMRQSTDRLGRFIDNVIDLAQARSGLLSLTPEPVDAKGALEEAAHSIQGRASAHGIRVRVKAPASLCVWADREQVGRILRQLLSNAVAFTPDGGTLTLWARALSARQVLWGVTDTGIGIPRSQWHRIFEQFQQLPENKDRARKTTGTGLGLTLARELVKAQGGRIWVAKSSPKGTTVQWTLPRTQRTRRNPKHGKPASRIA